MKTINERLEHLQKLQDCIQQCTNYNDGDMLDLKKYADMWQWLGMDVRVKKQIEWRERVIEKLTRFFATMAFELATESAAMVKREPIIEDRVIAGVHYSSSTFDDLMEVYL